VAQRFLRALGTDARRVRDVPAQDILAAQDALGEGVRTTWAWRPAIDGLALTGRPIDAIAAGAAAGIPLLAQHCVDECRLYQLADPGSAEQAERVLDDYFGPAGRDEILAAYAAHTADAEQLRVDVMTDERYAVPTTRLADAQSAHAPVWRSRFDGPLEGGARAVHGSDSAAVWAGGAGAAGEMHDAWGAFVAGGAPAAPTLPAWPEYSPARRPTMIFDGRGSRVEDDPDAARRAPWDGRDWTSGTWFALDGIA
jgi:para-nitrobenzyl esterase